MTTPNPADKRGQHMSDPAVKAARAQAREDTRIVREYLETCLIVNRRGPKRTPDRIQSMLATAEVKAETSSDVMAKLMALQEMHNLKAELARTMDAPDHSAAEAAFIAVGARYAARKGISYQAFRQTGVPAAVLRQAGIRGNAAQELGDSGTVATPEAAPATEAPKGRGRARATQAA